MNTLISCLVLLGLVSLSAAYIDDDYTKWDMSYCNETGYGECTGKTYPDHCVCSRPVKEMRAMIVNGTEAKRFQYCFLCGLVFSNTRFCAASILNERHVLTAAHCTDGFTADELSVVCGEHVFNGANYSRTSQVRLVESITQHSRYKPSVNFHNDISVLKLNGTLRFSFNVCPVCMPSQCIKMYYEPEIRIIGWGAGYTRGPQSKVLMEGCTRPVSTKSCASVFGEYVDQSSNVSCQICHEGKHGGTCQGDSGGPVLISHRHSKCLVIIGVTSYGSNNCGDYKPSVATRVCRYMNWIRKSIGYTVLCYDGPPQHSIDCQA